MQGCSRRGCGCLGGIFALIILVVWFAIALNTQPIAPTKQGFEGAIQAIVYTLIWIPRIIAGLFGFKPL